MSSNQEKKNKIYPVNNIILCTINFITKFYQLKTYLQFLNVINFIQFTTQYIQIVFVCCLVYSDCVCFLFSIFRLCLFPVFMAMYLDFVYLPDCSCIVFFADFVITLLYLILLTFFALLFKWKTTQSINTNRK